MSQKVLPAARIVEFVTNLLSPVMHAKRAFSMAGAVHADRFSIAGVGRAMASTFGTSPKHAIKQFDRLLSNAKVGLEAHFRAVVPWLVGSRDSILVSMDWTEYAKAGHSQGPVKVASAQRAHGLIDR